MVERVDQKKVDKAIEKIERIFHALQLTNLEALTTAEIIVNSVQAQIDEVSIIQRSDLQ